MIISITNAFDTEATPKVHRDNTQIEDIISTPPSVRTGSNNKTDLKAKVFQDFIHSVGRHDGATSDQGFDAVQAEVPLTDRRPKRSIISFRPLFVYREFEEGNHHEEKRKKTEYNANANNFIF